MTINPESEIQKLIDQLESKSGSERKNAREKLVVKGKNVLKYLVNLLDSPKYMTRWEAMKTMEEIGDAESIPVFIEAFEDDESEIRWIATEGLIRIGIQSIGPILRTIIDKSNSNSVFVFSEAHHVFYDLKKRGVLPEDFPIDKLLSVLKNPGWSEGIKPLVFEILKRFPPEV